MHVYSTPFYIVVVCLEKSLNLNLHVCSVTKLVGVVRTVGRVSLVCIIVMTVPVYGVDRSFWVFKCWGTFLHCIHRPTNSLAACTHMHTQPGIAKLRKVLQLREEWVWRQGHQLPSEEAGEEGEEEEKVRLRACIFYLNFQAICKQRVRV